MHNKWILIATVLLVAGAWGDSPQATLERLRERENSPGFRRAIISYQVIRESYENAFQLPSAKPLAEVYGGYQALVDSLAETDPQIAAAAFDRVAQIWFLLGEQDNVKRGLHRFEAQHPRAAAQLQILGNLPPGTTFGDERVEIRAIQVGSLENKEVVRVAFETRSLSGQAESLAMDLRVMNEAGNCQSQCFLDVPAAGWQRQETSLGEMFEAVRREGYNIGPDYRILPGDSIVRLTLGTVPRSYQQKGSEGAFDLAFENQVCQQYYVRRSK